MIVLVFVAFIALLILGVPVAFVIGCCKNDAKARLCHCRLQLFNNRLPLSGKLVEDERFKAPATQHCFKLIARGLIMPIHNEDLSRVGGPCKPTG